MNDYANHFSVNGKFPRLASYKYEWDFDLEKPEEAVSYLKNCCQIKADIFTFWQRPPYIEPVYQYVMERESIALLEYKNYQYWFEKILDDKTRNMIRKANKKGLVIKESVFNDEFVEGTVNIYNETPVRQGRPFLHYGNTFNEVKRANGEHSERSVFIGAYYEDILIGFMKLVFGHRTARAEQIIAFQKHRDKAPTNGLIAKAVEVCERKCIPYITYAKWTRGSITAFKKNNGFIRYDLPRYFIPLNIRGALAIKCRLHRRMEHLLPDKIMDRLIDVRSKWYRYKYR